MADETVVERGTEDGVAFVVTEKGGYPNIVKTKYTGDNIPVKFQESTKTKTLKK